MQIILVDPTRSKFITPTDSFLRKYRKIEFLENCKVLTVPNVSIGEDILGDRIASNDIKYLYEYLDGCSHLRIPLDFSILKNAKTENNAEYVLEIIKKYDISNIYIKYLVFITCLPDYSEYGFNNNIVHQISYLKTLKIVHFHTGHSEFLIDTYYISNPVRTERLTIPYRPILCYFIYNNIFVMCEEKGRHKGEICIKMYDIKIGELLKSGEKSLQQDTVCSNIALKRISTELFYLHYHYTFYLYRLANMEHIFETEITYPISRIEMSDNYIFVLTHVRFYLFTRTGDKIILDSCYFLQNYTHFYREDNELSIIGNVQDNCYYIGKINLTESTKTVSIKRVDMALSKIFYFSQKMVYQLAGEKLKNTIYIQNTEGTKEMLDPELIQPYKHLCNSRYLFIVYDHKIKIWCLEQARCLWIFGNSELIKNITYLDVVNSLIVITRSTIILYSLLNGEGRKICQLNS